MQAQACSYIAPIKLHTNPLQTKTLTMINPEGEDILLTDVVEGNIQVSHLFYNCYILLYIVIYIYI